MTEPTWQPPADPIATATAGPIANPLPALPPAPPAVPQAPRPGAGGSNGAKQPKKKRPKRPKAVHPTFGVKPPNPLDAVPKGPAGLQVNRLRSDPPTMGIGICGTVPLIGGYHEVIRNRWGGGGYHVRGLDSQGTVVDDFFDLPGPSSPLPGVEVEEENPYAQLFPGVGGFPAGIPGYPGYPGFPVPGYPGFPQQQSAPQFSQVYSAQANRENTRLQRELDDVKRELRDERTRTERLLRDMQTKEIEAMQAQAAAQHLEAIGALKLEMVAKAGTPAGDRAASAASDLMAAQMKSNTDMMLGVLKSQKTESMGDVIKLAQSMNPAGNQLDQLRGIVGMAKDLGDLARDPSDDSWQGVLKKAVGEVGPVLAERLAPPTPTPQLPPPPATDAAPVPQPPPEAYVPCPWPTIMAEVTRYHQATAAPRAAATQFNTFYRGLGDWTGDPGKIALRAGLPLINSELLRAQVGPKVGAFGGVERAHVEGFLALIATQEGAAWVDQFLAELGALPA